MKTKILVAVAILSLWCGTATAQWVVTDPGNLAQGIINSANEIVHSSTTATNVIANFKETVKIFEQSKKYYDALKSVTNLVRNARKVQECVLIVGDLSEIYVKSFNKMINDENFTAAELSAISVGYAKLLKEGTNELSDLYNIINPTDMSLTDKDRLDVIDTVHKKLTRLRNLTSYYTRKNIAVSIMRATKKDNAERTYQLYGPDSEKYW